MTKVFYITVFVSFIVGIMAQKIIFNKITCLFTRIIFTINIFIFLGLAHFNKDYAIKIVMFNFMAFFIGCLLLFDPIRKD